MSRIKETKRNNGYYEHKCIVSRGFDGKAIYKSFYSRKSKADARKKAEEYKLGLPRQITPETMTFGDFAAEYLTRAQCHVKPSTFKSNYENSFKNHFLPVFGGCLLSDIRKSDIEMFIIAKQDTLSVDYVKNMTRVLSSFFNDAVDNQIIKTNPCKNIRFRQEQKKEKRVYTSDQADKVLDFCKSDSFGMHVHILLSYGMSVSEYLGITIDDVDFEKLTISINKGAINNGHGEMLIGDPKNVHRNRVIAISKETADWIRKDVSHKFIANDDDDEVMPLFTFRYRYSQFMKRMQAFYGSQNIFVPALNPHELRHTRASIWVNEGKNLFAIAEMLGWSDLAMLRKVYAHPDIQELRKTLDL